MFDLTPTSSSNLTRYQELDNSFTEFLSTSGYKPDLQGLYNTIKTIKSLLLEEVDRSDDRETSPAEEHQRIRRHALYDAEDLFDKLITLAELKEQRLRDGNHFEKVRHFLSSKNPITVSWSMSQHAQKIRKELNAFAYDQYLYLHIPQNPILFKRAETYSYIVSDDVIGREDDVQEIIGRLRNSTDDVGFLTIVGMGGLGKTAVAKLVYNDESIKSDFDVRLWIWVSDQDGETLNIKRILLIILELMKFRFANSTTVDVLQKEYERILGGKRFFIVLDDIWTENPVEWQKLSSVLMTGGKGSRVIATTRSKTTARIIGSDTHELKGLSDDYSWRLFQMMAFHPGTNSPDFREIGQKIVKKCSNLPLAIGVVGSLVHRRPISEWLSVFEELDKLDESAPSRDKYSPITTILKVSYDHLLPSLKRCFSYCALFPKDYVIKKGVIMNLWEAQGYIVPFDQSQSIEDAGEEHFETLLQRYFFQDVKTNEYGDVESFKVHDLMHDLAQRVSEKEICVTNSCNPEVENNVRHIFDRTLKKEDDFSIQGKTSKIRSYLVFRKRWSLETGNESPLLSLNKSVKKLLCLRALALQGLRLTSLPDTMGNLLHLRCLNLAKNSMKRLPDSIVKLHNLQTLNLNKCDELNEWPKGFSKLVNLKYLYREKCYKLRCMPVGICNLTRLRVLTDFVVEDESVGGMQHAGQLKDLKALSGNLKTRLSIQFHVNFTSSEGYSWEGGCLEGAEHLREVEMGFSFPSHVLHPRRLDDKRGAKEEAVMEKLQPPPNLRKFTLSHYAGDEITRWGRAQDNWSETSFLPHLVHIKISDCHRLQQLPLLSKLLHLKSLFLYELKNLNYVEEEAIITSGSESSGPSLLDTVFFPSLESLEIIELKNLQGWWRAYNRHRQLAFSSLCQLNIENCPRLTSFPMVPSHTKVELRKINKGLKIRSDEAETSSSFQPTHPILTCP